MPALTIATGALAWLAWLVPSANPALEFSRDAIADGQLWRLASGHLTHWTPSHLTWDLTAFVFLGSIVEMRSRRLLAILCANAMILISGVIWCVQPDLFFYRGLSGIDSALFAAVAIGLLHDAIGSRQFTAGILPLTALVGLAAKTVFELHTGGAIFVAASDAFAPVPLAHLAGIATALGVVPWFVIRHPHRTGSLTSRQDATRVSPSEPSPSRLT